MLCLVSAADMKCFFPVLSCLAVLGKWLLLISTIDVKV